MTNPSKVLACFVCVVMIGSECGCGLGEHPNFSLVGGRFRAFSSRRSSLMQTFVETVDFDVAHLSFRDHCTGVPYLKAPPIMIA